jgi:hypothetical protein
MFPVLNGKIVIFFSLLHTKFQYWRLITNYPGFKPTRKPLYQLLNLLNNEKVNP